MESGRLAPNAHPGIVADGGPGRITTAGSRPHLIVDALDHRINANCSSGQGGSRCQIPRRLLRTGCADAHAREKK
jgi:hypothetical protein